MRCGRLITNLDVQEYKDILSTIDLCKEGVTVTHSVTGAPGEPDYRKEENVYINNEKCLWAVIDEDENGVIRYNYYLTAPIPPEYQTEAPFVATLEVNGWDNLKNVLVAAGVAK
jgi:hypothetical protein